MMGKSLENFIGEFGTIDSAGTTGSRSLAQYGTATAVKMTTTTWIISGSGLT